MGVKCEGQSVECELDESELHTLASKKRGFSPIRIKMACDEVCHGSDISATRSPLSFDAHDKSSESELKVPVEVALSLSVQVGSGGGISP